MGRNLCNQRGGQGWTSYSPQSEQRFAYWFLSSFLVAPITLSLRTIRWRLLSNRRGKSTREVSEKRKKTDRNDARGRTDSKKYVYERKERKKEVRWLLTTQSKRYTFPCIRKKCRVSLEVSSVVSSVAWSCHREKEVRYWTIGSLSLSLLCCRL